MTLRLAGLFAVAVLAASLVPARCEAFGPDGHEIGATVAARHLTPEARATVERLLGEPAEAAFARWSSWADEQRDGGVPGQPLHYVNFPRDSCSYDPARDCRDGRCSLAAIERYTRVLADSRDDGERATALKYLVHLVIDLHQPLHTGYADDKGANEVQVRFRGRGTNVHQLWDSGMLEERGRPVAMMVDDLARRPPPVGVDLAWSENAPVRWAEESCALIPGMYPKVRRKIDAAFVARGLHLIEARLQLGALRLAALINQNAK